MTENIDLVINEIIQKLTLKIFKAAEDNLISDGSLDTGNLLRDVEVGKDFFHFKAPYADIINKGRGPGKINPKVLEGWIRRKLGIRNEAQVRAVSIKIANKIRTRGFEGTLFVDRAIETERARFHGK
jgi:hypothetical protein